MTTPDFENKEKVVTLSQNLENKNIDLIQRKVKIINDELKEKKSDETKD